jgi:hypothetical protein
MRPSGIYRFEPVAFSHGTRAMHAMEVALGQSVYFGAALCGLRLSQALTNAGVQWELHPNRHVSCEQCRIKLVDIAWDNEDVRRWNALKTLKFPTSGS